LDSRDHLCVFRGFKRFTETNQRFQALERAGRIEVTGMFVT
jgi:hypothetical protein